MPAKFSDNSKEENGSLKFQEPHFSYGPSEEEQLSHALRRTYTERFLVMTKLMKINMMFRKAKITHQQSEEPGQSE